MNLVIKGFIIGIGKILPGISGALLAITLGEYDKIISSIANIKKKPDDNIKYLSKIGIGILSSIIITSKIIVRCLNKYYFATMLLFTGIIIGNIPKMFKKIKITKKEIIIILATILIILMPNRFNLKIINHRIDYNIIEFIKLTGIGIIDAISSIIPGISGTAILMATGYYYAIIEAFSTITNITRIKKNIFIFIPFLIGFIVGTISVSKLVNIIIKKYPNKMNIIIITFMIITTLTLLKNTIIKITSEKEYIIGFIFLIIGISLPMLRVIKINKENIFK